jgi:hypothetical protein
MAVHVAVLDLELKLSREQLIHIMSQQLTMSWRHYPHNRDECEQRIRDYLLDVIVGNLNFLDRLEHQFQEKPKELDSMTKHFEKHWAEVRSSGPRLADTATKIIDEFFPELKPPKRKRKK